MWFLHWQADSLCWATWKAHNILILCSFTPTTYVCILTSNLNKGRLGDSILLHNKHFISSSFFVLGSQESPNGQLWLRMFHEVGAQTSFCAISSPQEGLTGTRRSSAKVVSSQAWQTWSGFWQEASHVQMWELDHKEGWAQKNWCFRTLVLEKTLESPFDCKEIKPDNPKGNQLSVFVGRTDRENWRFRRLATWCEELTHWKRPSCWERLKAKGEGRAEGEMVR